MVRQTEQSDGVGGEAGRTVACVSYLNAKPLIDDARGRFDDTADGGAVRVVYDVPAAIPGYVQLGEAAMGLVPVADLLREGGGLEAWPVGGIACDGPTLTVRLFCRCEREAVRSIAADGDSHTSVVLASLLVGRWTGELPRVERVSWSGVGQGEASEPTADALLLIGDKVVKAAPPRWMYPHQVDLGAAWREWTGLPFVFAAWAGRVGASLEGLAERLAAVRRDNVDRREALALTHAGGHGWPAELAVEYLTRVLRYELGERELAGLARFAAEAASAGLVDIGEAPMRSLEGSGAR
ncbi:MAG: MqnA/MqnD/SBP family protein [Planctomycetota bacterium]